MDIEALRKELITLGMPDDLETWERVIGNRNILGEMKPRIKELQEIYDKTTVGIVAIKEDKAAIRISVWKTAQAVLKIKAKPRRPDLDKKNLLKLWLHRCVKYLETTKKAPIAIGEVEKIEILKTLALSGSHRDSYLMARTTASILIKGASLTKVEVKLATGPWIEYDPELITAITNHKEADKEIWDYILKLVKDARMFATVSHSKLPEKKEYLEKLFKIGIQNGFDWEGMLHDVRCRTTGETWKATIKIEFEHNPRTQLLEELLDDPLAATLTREDIKVVLMSTDREIRELAIRLLSKVEQVPENSPFISNEVGLETALEVKKQPRPTKLKR